jgi:D-alanyl-D-alanine carboxypeptidase
VLTVRRLITLFAMSVVVACSAAASPPAISTTLPVIDSTTTTTSTTTTSSTIPPSTTTTPPTTTTLADGVTQPPSWLGTRSLPVDENGVAAPQETPPELQDRRFTTTDLLAPPLDDAYHSSISELSTDVIERSTWQSDCPVGVDDLRYLNMTFWGFDQRPHTGEMIVNAGVAADVVDVFAKLYEARFPIEEMRITMKDELDAPPTGDGNDTESFVCRPVTGGAGWSQHAYGLAIDLDPFHNPYVKGNVVLPELSRAYLDRTRGLPGMIVEGDVVTDAFDSIGWGWGGRWISLKDFQHFSRNGR